MKIVSIDNETGIVFDDGSKITCEECSKAGYSYSYADFEQLDDMAKDIDFPKDLTFEAVNYTGFRFGFGNTMFFIPCYSIQNGYYSSTVDIYYNNELKLRKVDSEINSDDCF